MMISKVLNTPFGKEEGFEVQKKSAQKVQI